MFHGKTHYKWPFSIAILTLPEGTSSTNCAFRSKPLHPTPVVHAPWTFPRRRPRADRPPASPWRLKAARRNSEVFFLGST